MGWRSGNSRDPHAVMIQNDTTREVSMHVLRRGGNLGRFTSRHRPEIEAQAALSPRFAELSVTFPALLFALSTGYADAELRDIARHTIRCGAPLRSAADAIGLPWWLRRLPPECFEEPLAEIPDGRAFGCRVANLVPDDPVEAARWFARVTTAFQCAGEEYALWIARQRRFPAGVVGGISESLLAAWAWHCLHPDTPGAGVVRCPWSDTMSLKRALEEAKAWSLRLDLAVAIGAGIEDSWFPAGTFGNFEFVPLVRLDDFLSESLAMNNCLDQFADQVRLGQTRVFSIRKGGRPVADVEIGAHDDDCAVPRIVQLRGPRNRRAGPEIWQAALAWLACQTFRPLPRAMETTDRQRRQQLIRAIWRPMMDCIKGKPVEGRLQALAFGQEVSRSYRAFQVAPSLEESVPPERAVARRAESPLARRREIDALNVQRTDADYRDEEQPDARQPAILE